MRIQERTTKEWRALDHAHHLHPYTDPKTLSAAVALGNLGIFESEGLVDRVREDIGPYFRKSLQQLADAHPIVGAESTAGDQPRRGRPVGRARRAAFRTGLNRIPGRENMTMRGWIGGLAVALMGLASTSAAAQELLYKLERTATLPSTDTGWDYIKLEPGGTQLFMARLKDGLTVFDVAANKAVGAVENSTGANGPLLLPQFDRGYVAMTDGSMLTFKLSTLAPIARKPLSTTGGLNSAIYDPATKRVHMIESSRPAESTFFTFDAATGKALGKTVFPFRKIDDPATDGFGTLFVPARRDNLILKVNASTLAEQARWTVECNVSKVYYQKATNRVLAACLGDAPLFLAIDAATGRTVATVPIGKGIDGFIVDEARGRIVTSNGVDGTLTVIKQSGPDAYALAGTVSTRPGGRMMDFDNKTGRLFVVAADFTQSRPDGAGATKRTYHPDSFVVLTYSPL